MAIIKGLLKRVGKYRDGIYPYTQTDCVFDENGNSLDGILSNINTNKQNTLIAGRGIGITGNTINNNFESLIGDATIATGDKLVIRDASNSNNLAGSSITFGANANQYLANNGTWQNIRSLTSLWYYSGTYTDLNVVTNQLCKISSISNYSAIIIEYLDVYNSNYIASSIIPCTPSITTPSKPYRIDHNGQWRTLYCADGNNAGVQLVGYSNSNRMLPLRIWGIK